MFWEKFCKICQERGTTPTAVVLALNLSKGSVTHWRQGKTPHPATLTKIANHFGISVSQLIENDTDATTITITPEEKNLLELIKSLTEDEVKQASDYLEYIISKRGK